MRPKTMSRKPGWPCASTIPGMTVLPVRLTRAAPAGAVTSPRRPTWVKRPPSTRNAESSIGALASPVMSRAPSNSVMVAGCATAGGEAIATTKPNATTSRAAERSKGYRAVSWRMGFSRKARWRADRQAYTIAAAVCPRPAALSMPCADRKGSSEPSAAPGQAYAGGPVMSPEFEQLYHRHVITSYEKQLRLADVIGTHCWSFSMHDGSLTFQEDGEPARAPIVFAAQLLGTAAEGDS